MKDKTAPEAGNAFKHLNRVALRPEEAAAVLGIGRTTMFQLLSSGEIPFRQVGRLRLVSVSALERWMDKTQVAKAG